MHIILLQYNNTQKNAYRTTDSMASCKLFPSSDVVLHNHQTVVAYVDLNENHNSINWDY